MSVLWMMLVGCGGKASDICIQMLECDQSWAADDAERDALWGGEEDAQFADGGSCWADDESAVTCDAACTTEVASYQQQIDILIDFGDLDAVPAGCE